MKKMRDRAWLCNSYNVSNAVLYLGELSHLL